MELKIHKKRLLFFLLPIIVIIMAFSGITAFADEEAYTWEGDGTPTVDSSTGKIWLSGCDGTLTVNGEISVMIYVNSSSDVTITGSGTISDTIQVSGSSNLTIDGSVTFSGTVNNYIGSTTTIKGGTFTGTVSNTKGTVNISDGTFTNATVKNYASNGNGGTFTISGGTFENGTIETGSVNAITISGGTFTNETLTCYSELIITDGIFSNVTFVDSVTLGSVTSTLGEITIYHGQFTGTDYASYLADTVEVEGATAEIIVISDGSTDYVHAVTKTADATNATCTEDGNIEYYTCVYCGEYVTATTDEDGNTTYTAVDSVTIEATGHNYTWGYWGDWSLDEDGNPVVTAYLVCENCGDEIVAGETKYTTTVLQSATCTKPEIIRYAAYVTTEYDGGSYLKYNLTRYDLTGDYADHDYEVTESKDATCDEDGTITYTCSVCGDSYTETIEATGHDYDCDNGVWTWTETDDGYTATYTVTCSNDSSHTLTYDATVTSTTDSKGNTVYTAAVVVDSDNQVYNDTLTVENENNSTDDGNAGESDDSDDASDDDVAQTDDASNIAFLLTLLIASCVAFAETSRRKKTLR